MKLLIYSILMALVCKFISNAEAKKLVRSSNATAAPQIEAELHCQPANLPGAEKETPQIHQGGRTSKLDLIREQLIAFYLRHDPSKVDNVDTILAKVSLEHITRTLQNKYGETISCAPEPMGDALAQDTYVSSTPTPGRVRKRRIGTEQLLRVQQVCLDAWLGQDNQRAGGGIRRSRAELALLIRSMAEQGLLDALVKGTAIFPKDNVMREHDRARRASATAIIATLGASFNSDSATSDHDEPAVTALLHDLSEAESRLRVLEARNARCACRRLFNDSRRRARNHIARQEQAAKQFPFRPVFNGSYRGVSSKQPVRAPSARRQSPSPICTERLRRPHAQLRVHKESDTAPTNEET